MVAFECREVGGGGLCNTEQSRGALRTTLDRVIPADRVEAKIRLARIEQMIETCRRATERRFLRRAMRLWRQAESQQQLASLEAPPARVH